MPVVCPHCHHTFGGNKVSSRHIANCPNWPRTLTDPCLCGFQATSDNKLKAHKRACPDWQARDKKAVRAQRLRETSLARYGVEDCRRMESANQKREETNVARYGAANPFSRESNVFDKVQSSLDGKRPVLRGAANPFAKPEVKAKIRLFFKVRYGVENPQQNSEVKAKTRRTNLVRYGGTLLGSPVLRAKARLTNATRYGDAFPQRTQFVKDRQRETNLDRWGVEWTGQNPEVRRKQLETHHERYGSHWFASEEGKAEIKRVFQERYGVDHWMQKDGAWEQLVQTFQERYGVDHPLQLAEFLEKQRNTNMRNWGAPHPMQNREHARERLEKMRPGVGPNGLERTVLELAPAGSLLFTGDFTFWRWLPTLGKHKNPDFIVPGPDPENPKRGVTRVVEAFGDFWHSRMFTGKVPFDHEQDLIDAYAEVGISCLVLWESEIHADPEATRLRLNAHLTLR